MHGREMKTPTSGAGSPQANTSAAEEKKSVNGELWQACAGPLVNPPAAGTHVVYFPQGHSEQVAASMKKGVDAQIPNYPNIPSKLLCILHSVTLHADPETDEVYAKITLQPVPSFDKDDLLRSNSSMKVQKPQAEFFCKTLTPSDTSTHGGFSVPRWAAEKIFPPLDFTMQPPVQEIVAKDLHDNIWTFRHIYRGQPKRHLLTTGWSLFVTGKRLFAGDSVLFIRDGKRQKLLLGIRRAHRQPTNLSSSVLSSDSMQIGILAAAAHAAANNSPFTVFYNPRSSSSEFVIPLAKYYKAACGNQISLGMRFRMMFETEESGTRRYMGTITGISDLDPVRWKNSQWCNLQVGWDESGTGERRRNRVSIWEIEPVIAPFFICPTQPFLHSNRPRQPGMPDDDPSDPNNVFRLTMSWIGDEYVIKDPQALPSFSLVQWMNMQQDSLANSLQPNYMSPLSGSVMQNLTNISQSRQNLAGQGQTLQTSQARSQIFPSQSLNQDPGVFQESQSRVNHQQLQRNHAQLQSLMQSDQTSPQMQVFQKLQQQQQSFHVQQSPNTDASHSHVLSQRITRNSSQNNLLKFQQPSHQHQIGPALNHPISNKNQLSAANNDAPSPSISPSADNCTNGVNIQSSVPLETTSMPNPGGDLVCDFHQKSDVKPSINLSRSQNQALLAPQPQNNGTHTDYLDSSSSVTSVLSQNNVNIHPPSNNNNSVSFNSLSAILFSDPRACIPFRGSNNNMDLGPLQMTENMTSINVLSGYENRNEAQGELSSPMFSQSFGVPDMTFNSIDSTINDDGFLNRATWAPPQLLRMRTYTKVYKRGAVGRSIDISGYTGYDELKQDLARRFGIEGQLEDGQRVGWKLVYVDHENDVLLVGDDPWEEFVSCVRCIKILSPQEVQKLSLDGDFGSSVLPNQACSNSDNGVD